jgi:hypothetical protein
VSCNATSAAGGSSQCVNWAIAPNAAAANVNVANLYYYTQKGTLIFVGQHYNPPSIADP